MFSDLDDFQNNESDTSVTYRTESKDEDHGDIEEEMVDVNDNDNFEDKDETVDENDTEGRG